MLASVAKLCPDSSGSFFLFFLLNALVQKCFGALELFFTSGAEAFAGPVDEIGEHTHP